MSISLNLTDDSTMAYAARPLKRPPSHPGLVAADILEGVVSTRAAANALGMTNTNLDRVLKGDRPVTAETAARFGVYFGNGAEFWLRLQADYDAHLARTALAAELKKIVPLAKD